jgi:hypothetical protein
MFFNKLIWWDGAVYLGMGKYLFSSGVVGVFEPMRQLFLPFLLGLFWKIGFNMIYFGKFFELVCAFFSLVFVYLIGKDMFGRKIGLISTYILGFNFLFLFFTFRIYTEMVSLFFITGGFYFLLKFLKKNKFLFLILSSFFIALCFLTKYPLGLFLVAVNVILFIDKKYKEIIIFDLLFLIFVSPYFIYNFLEYGNSLYLLSASNNYYSTNLKGVYDLLACRYCPKFFLPKTGFIYFETLLLFFNVMIPFFIYGLYKLFKNRMKYFLLVPLLLVFLYFQINYLKEERYILPIFPFVALIIGYGFSFFKRKYWLLIIYIVLSLISLSFFMDENTFYYSFFMNSSYDCSSVITSDPHTALNYKTLFPYEVFDNNFEPTDNLLNKEGDCIFYVSSSSNATNQIDFIRSLGYEQIYFEDRYYKYAVFKLGDIN